MATIDFITAFGRLLRDGALRDALALNPASVATQLNVREDDRPALLQLIPEDLDFQARVLLRKRLDLVRSIVPNTCRRLVAKEWPLFHDYARNSWPSERNAPVSDAYHFCRHLQHVNPQSVEVAEWNRLRFVLDGKRLAVGLVRRTIHRHRSKISLQFLFRTRGDRWHEFFLSVGS